MHPKYGGSPLPHSPVCMPQEHYKASQYVLVLEEALKQSGWSVTQRRRLRSLVRLWTFRAEGRDQEFEKNGSFGRAPGAAPPTAIDASVEKWRRLIPHDAKTRRLRRVPYTSREAIRERDRYK